MNGLVVLKTGLLGSLPGTGTLVIDGPVTCTGPVVFPSSLRVVFTDRGRVVFANDQASVRFLLSIEAGAYPIFETGLPTAQGTPRVLFDASSGQGTVRADWWGASGAVTTLAQASRNAAAIRAAVASLPSLPDGLGIGGSAPTGVVRFGSGTYFLNEPIALSGRISIEGRALDRSEFRPTDDQPVPEPPLDGATRLKLVGSASGTPVVLLVTGAGTRVSLSDLTLWQGVSSVQPLPGSTGVLVTKGAELALKAVRLDRFDIGIRLMDAGRVAARGSVFTDNRYAVVIERVVDATISDCCMRVDLPEGVGVVVGPVAGAACGITRIRDCRFESSLGLGMGIRVRSCQAFTSTDSVFDGLTCGVLFQNGSLVGPGAEVGQCRFYACQTEVDAGDVSHLVRAHRRGGMATRAAMNTAPPSDEGWRKGDAIRNVAPSEGEPFGWLCVGHDAMTLKPKWRAFGRIGDSTKKVPDRPEKIAGTHHYHMPVDKSPAAVPTTAATVTNPRFDGRPIR